MPAGRNEGSVQIVTALAPVLPVLRQAFQVKWSLGRVGNIRANLHGKKHGEETTTQAFDPSRHITLPSGRAVAASSRIVMTVERFPPPVGRAAAAGNHASRRTEDRRRRGLARTHTHTTAGLAFEP